MAQNLFVQDPISRALGLEAPRVRGAFAPQGQPAAANADNPSFLPDLAARTGLPGNLIEGLAEHARAGGAFDPAAFENRAKAIAKRGGDIREAVVAELGDAAPDVFARANAIGEARGSIEPAPDRPGILSRLSTAFQIGNQSAIKSSQGFAADMAPALEESWLGKGLDAVTNAALLRDDGELTAFGRVVERFNPGVQDRLSTTPEQRAKTMRNNRDQIAAAAEDSGGFIWDRNLARLAEAGQSLTSWSDVRGLASALSFIGEQGAMSLPQMGVALASGPMSPVTQILMLGGEANDELKQRTDLDEGTRVAVASGAGLAMAALDSIGLGAVFGKLLPSQVATGALSGRLASAMTRNGMTRAASEAIQSAIVEGTTEALQESIVMGATAAFGGKYKPGEITERLAGSFFGGAAAGAPFGALGGLRSETTTPEQDAAPEEPPAAPGPQLQLPPGNPTLALPSPDGFAIAPPPAPPTPNAPNSPGFVPLPSPDSLAGGPIASPPVSMPPVAPPVTDPRGPMERIANTMPAPQPVTPPAPAPQPIYPDLKAGQPVTLADPDGRKIEAVFLREENGNVIVRDAGQELVIPAPEFDAAMRAADPAKMAAVPAPVLAEPQPEIAAPAAPQPTAEVIAPAPPPMTGLSIAPPPPEQAGALATQAMPQGPGKPATENRLPATLAETDEKIAFARSMASPGNGGMTARIKKRIDALMEHRANLVQEFAGTMAEPQDRVQPDMLTGEVTPEDDMARVERERVNWGRMGGMVKGGYAADLNEEIGGFQIKGTGPYSVRVTAPDGAVTAIESDTKRELMTRIRAAVPSTTALVGRAPMKADVPTAQEKPVEPLAAIATRKPRVGDELPTSLVLRIGQKTYAVGSVADASEKVQAVRDANDFTSSNFPQITIEGENGDLLGEVAYNGRVFDRRDGAAKFDVLYQSNEQAKLRAQMAADFESRKNEQPKPEVQAALARPAATSPADPTPAQAEAGNYKMKHVRWQGLDISIETEKGQERRGYDEDGNVRWSMIMPADYGYIRRTEGADGDHVDVYLGPDEGGDRVFVVDQNDAETSAFDEHKVMAGFRTAREAKATYLKAFSDGKGEKRFGNVVPMSVAEFKAWLADGDMKEPVAGTTFDTRQPEKEAQAVPDKAKGDTGFTAQDMERAWDGMSFSKRSRLLIEMGVATTADGKLTAKGRLGAMAEWVEHGKDNQAALVERAGPIMLARAKASNERSDAVAAAIASVGEFTLDAMASRHTEIMGKEPFKKGNNRFTDILAIGAVLGEANDAFMPMNRASRQVFEEFAGVKLPKTQRDTAAFIKAGAPFALTAPKQEQPNAARPAIPDERLPVAQGAAAVGDPDQKGRQEGPGVAEQPQPAPAPEQATVPVDIERVDDATGQHEPQPALSAEPDWSAFEKVGFVQGKGEASDSWFRLQTEGEGVASYKVRAIRANKDLPYRWKLTRDFRPKQGVTPPPTRQIGTVDTAAEAIAQLRENGLKTPPAGVVIEPAAPAPAAAYGAGNTLVTADRAAEVRKLLADKLRNQFNAGIDPQILSLGTELAVFHMEAGARRFVDMARAVAGDLGVKPSDLKRYLRSWYVGARTMMEDNDVSILDMDDDATIKTLISSGAMDGLAPAEADAEATVSADPQDAPVSVPAPQSNIEVLTNDGISQIQTNAARFQYKSGGDQSGVSERLRDVKSWDSNRTGIALVYEYKDGRREIVDGHQRLGLAKQLIAEGQQVDLPVRVLREAAGITTSDARRMGAEKNIAEGTGTALDAAKIFRETGMTAAQLNLPRSSQMVRDGENLAKLSDLAFGMVVNEVASQKNGAMVGALVTDNLRHADVLSLLTKFAPANQVQAESMIRQAVETASTETQTDMFGDIEVSTNLYVERAKIIDQAMKSLGNQITTFKTLMKEGDTITSEGNVLARENNAARLSADDRARAVLMQQANTKGPISDALTEAARSVKAGGTVSAAARQFVADVRRADLGSQGVGIAPDGSGTGGTGPSDGPAEAVGKASPAGITSEQTEAGDQLVIPGAEKSSASPQSERDKAEIAARQQQSKMRRLDQGRVESDDGGLFGKPEKDLFADGKESRMPKEPEAARDTSGRFRRATDWVRNLPRKSKAVQNFNRKTFFSDMLTDAMGGVDGAVNLLSLVPMRPLLSEIGGKIHSAKVFLRAKEEMDALRNDWQARTAKTSDAWLKLNGKGKAENAALMDLMHRSTLAGIDPSKPFESSDLVKKIRAETKGKKVSERQQVILDQDVQMRDDHARLAAEFMLLPRDYQAMFRKVATEYDAMGDAFEAAVLENMRKAGATAIKRAERAHREELRRIQDEGLTSTLKASAINDADQKLANAKSRGGWAMNSRINSMRAEFESNRLKGVYFPLARFGNYFVTGRDASGKVVSFSKAEGKAMQTRIAAEVAAKGLTVETGVMSDRASLRSQVDPTFVADVISILGDAEGVDSKVMDAVWQRWLETLPDQSIRTSRIHRKGREGYQADAVRAFTNHMFHGAHQLARLKYGIDLQEAVAEAELEARKADNPNRAMLVVNEMSKRLDFIMQPTNAGWTARASSLAFIWYLGATPAAAMANISQTTVIGPAVLGARFTKQGVSGAVSELAKAIRDTAGVALREIDGPKGVLESKRLTDEEKDAIREALRRGTIDKTQAHDLASVAETGIEYNARWESIMRVVGGMFHKAEVLNRTSTFLAAYRMGRKDGLIPEDATQAAADMVWKTHFDYSNTSRPRFMQGDWPKVFLLFRQYTVNMLFRMARDLHQSFSGESPAARKEARAQFIGLTLSMMAHAGIKGVWGYAIITSLLGLFFDGGDDDVDRYLQDALLVEGEGMGAAAWNFSMGMVLNGVPGHLTGTDMTNRIGMPTLWFQKNDRDMSDGGAAYSELVSQLTGPFFGIGAKVFDGGWQILYDGEVQRGLETMAPKAIRDVMKATRYATDGVTTRNGDPLIEDTGWVDVLKQAMGFTPAAVAERYDANSRMMNRQTRITDQRSGLMRQAGDLLMAGDTVSESVLDQIQAFNREYPTYPITSDSIRQSVSSRQRASQRNEFGVALNPKLNERLRGDEAPLVY